MVHFLLKCSFKALESKYEVEKQQYKIVSNFQDNMFILLKCP